MEEAGWNWVSSNKPDLDRGEEKEISSMGESKRQEGMHGKDSSYFQNFPRSLKSQWDFD